MSKKSKGLKETDDIEVVLDRYVKKFNKSIYDEMAKAFEDTYYEFVKVWQEWKKNKRSDSNTNPSRFFLQASSAYWDDDIKNNIVSNDSNDISLDINPENIKTKIYSNWGENYGKQYDAASAFEMMYYHGIMGYDKNIVKKSWYKTKESQEKYYKRYHLKYPINRSKILKNIFEADIVPPVAKKKPYQNMEKKIKDIQDQKHLDKKWKEISKDLDSQINKILNSK